MNAEVNGLEESTQYAQHGQWHAFLNLRFAPTTRGVRLVEKAHRGPLYIQKPFYPEGADTPHAYLLHPPGGLVSGDELSVSVTVEQDANALVTTPGAGRMYKARDDQTPQIQRTLLNVKEGASLEWLPLEAIIFPQANAVFDSQIQLTGSAKVIYWDVVSLGLPANNVPFASGSLDQNLTIVHDDRLVLQERFVLNDQTRALLDARVGLNGHPVQGLLVAGPFESKPDETLQACRDIGEASKECIGVTFSGAFVVVRVLNGCSEQARLSLESMWSVLRPALLQRSSCAPRIWKT